MKEPYICQSCGKVLKHREDFAGNEIGNPYCSDCADEFGHRKRYSQILNNSREFLVEQLGVSAEEAEKMAEENISRIPAWLRRDRTFVSGDYIIVTDIGSTTTKALLLVKSEDDYHLGGMYNAATTVEKPFDDVKIGVYNAVRGLEKQSSLTLLSEEATPSHLKFSDSVNYLTTSSAGGGLQILIIGLTLFDSASSGKRTAFGAGGVILDTMAIDDKRTALEQMQAMKILHPDIILMAGGIDGGAIAPLLRLGEILQIADPQPKFGDKNHIPLIFAGNESARPFISGLFQDRFELYLTPNIRPTMEKENLGPAREKIHKLFMDNVMEQAPGYQALKKIVADDIVPTPLGVIGALQIISEKLGENVMSVDLGGATTDIFSNILGKYYRTVSANYGLSYSISNVLKDCGLEKIKRWLPDSIDENFIRNYIGNKMLYPTHIPVAGKQTVIEQAVAREAVRMAKKQHLEMNFNTREIGFLDKLVKTHQDLEKITQAFYIDKGLEAKKFHMHDINVLIGAGGAISRAESKQESLVIIYDGFEPQGITEIWKDRDFLTPHLGKLSAVKEELASRLLTEKCLEKLAVTIRPICRKWKENDKVMEIEINDNNSQENLIINTDEFRYLNFPRKHRRKFRIKLEKGYFLNNDAREYAFQSDADILIDTRPVSDFKSAHAALGIYHEESPQDDIEQIFQPYLERKSIEEGKQKIKVELPYKGKLAVNTGDQVKPDTLIGENRYDPPRIYVISLFDKKYLKLDPDNLESCLLVKEGDEIKFGQRIVEVGSRKLLDELKFNHYFFESPLRGRIEKINTDSGTLILREIQDYSTRPRTINIARKLNVPPRMIARYLKKKQGEFIYAGDPLAGKLLDDHTPSLIASPATGTLKEVNIEKGTVTIHYDKKPFRRLAGLCGIVTATEPGQEATIEYRGFTLHGILGLGSEAWGKLNYLENPNALDRCSEADILISPLPIDLAFLQKAQKRKVRGIVAPAINNADIISFLQEEIGVALTGNEDIPFPLIITEGFGRFPMEESYRQLFRRSTGKWIFIDGHTQIRAGVIRPRIIIQERVTS